MTRHPEKMSLVTEYVKNTLMEQWVEHYNKSNPARSEILSTNDEVLIW